LSTCFCLGHSFNLYLIYFGGGYLIVYLFADDPISMIGTPLEDCPDGLCSCGSLQTIERCNYHCCKRAERVCVVHPLIFIFSSFTNFLFYLIDVCFSDSSVNQYAPFGSMGL